MIQNKKFFLTSIMILSSIIFFQLGTASFTPTEPPTGTPTPTPPTYCDSAHCPPGTLMDTICAFNETCCSLDLSNCHCAICNDAQCGCSGENCSAGGGTCGYDGVPGDRCKRRYPIPTPITTPTLTPCPYNCGDSCPVGTYCKPSDCTCPPCGVLNCGGPGWKCKIGEACDSTTSPCSCKKVCDWYDTPGPSLFQTCEGFCIGGLTCTKSKTGPLTCGCE